MNIPNKISIYRLADDEKHNQEIDLAILTASLKVIDLQLSKQLDIIMSWNRPDVAKKYILLSGSGTEVIIKLLENLMHSNFTLQILLIKKQILEDKMFEALSQDKVEFVKLFLEYGVNLQKFLTFKRIHDLYNTVILLILSIMIFLFNQVGFFLLEKRANNYSNLHSSRCDQSN